MFVDSADRTPHYSLRKLSVGVASVLLSTTLWMGANGSVVHAGTGTVNNVAGRVSKTQTASNDQTQSQNGQGQGAASVATEAKSKEDGKAQLTTPNKAQAQDPASAERRQASTAKQATGQDGKENAKTYQEASDDLDGKKGDLSSLIKRAEQQDGLTVTKEKDETYTTKKEALDDLDKQVADIQGKVTKYESDKAAYDAAMNVYNQDENKWETARKSADSPDSHMVKDISQGLSFANEHDASLEVTSESDKPVKFIKSSAWLGKDGEGVYADGITTGGNISKSFSDSDISKFQDEGTGKDIKDWGNTYTGVQLKVGESVVARYTGLKNSVYIDKHNVLHKLSKAQVKYTLNETTANDNTANIFLSNSPNIALWYGAAGDKNGEVDLTVALTFYDENGNPITMGKDSNAWLDMSSLNNGTTKIEYFNPNGNTTKYIPGSSITNTNADNTQHADGRWYANQNNEIKPAPASWDNPTSADRYYGASIMELEGNSFHIGQKIIKYNPSLTLSRNVYCWFALDSRLATAYKPVKPNEPEKPSDIAWHEVIYKLNHTVKRTIHYVVKGGPAQAPADRVDQLSFTATKNLATGAESWSGNQDFKDVTSPVLTGYNVDRQVVSNKNIAHDHADIVETVTYTLENQKLDVVYHDDTNNTDLKKDKISGDSNSVAYKDGKPYTTGSSIDDYKNKGYELVSDSTGGKQLTFDDDSSKDQHYVVHLKHGTVTVTPDDKNPVEPGDKINPNDPDPNSPKYQDDVKHDNLAKDAKQTIHYEGAGTDTPADNVTTQKDAFTRTVTYDKVTGKSTTSKWSKTKTTFDKVDNPVVKGYTTKNKQAGGLTATPEDPEVTDTVVYTPNGSIVPVDPNGNPIPGTHPVPYETDPTDPTKVVDGKVPEVPGWTPKNGKPGDPVVPTDPSKDTKVPYDHIKTTGDTKVEGKQTVTYVYKDKNGKVVKTKTVEQDTTFTGKTTTDEVTGETTTVWDQKDHKYTEVTTPVEPGYTADKKSVGGETVTPDNPNRSYTVVYTSNGSVVPVDSNGNPIPNTPSVPYETDPHDPTKVVNGKVPEVPSWTPKTGKPGDPVVPTNPTQNTKVPYDHTKTTSDTTVPGKQTVTYVYKDKDGKVVNTKTKTVEQDTAFTGKTTKDEFTGKTTTTWDQKDHKYTAVKTPVEPGYTADQESVGGDTVTPDDPNRSYEVVYTPNGSIVPVDPNGNPIPGTHPVPYETDPTDPTKVVDGKVPEVPGWTPKNGKPGDLVTPKDPTKDTEIPYDHTMTPGETTATGKVEGLPEKPAKSAKAPAEKLVKTPVKAPKAVKTAEPAKTISIKESAQAQDQLPQTGEDNSKAAFGLGLASILGGIGILGAFKRKKKEN